MMRQRAFRGECEDASAAGRRWWFWLVLMSLGLHAAGAAEPATEPTRYMIVVTGGELLAGAYADGHTYYLTRTLGPLGLECVGSMCVDDKEADVRAALRFATGRAPLVIVTGGLGPTDNDITREALSGFTGVALAERADVLEELAGRFGMSPDQLGENLRRQTQVPERGTYLKNAYGTAVGLVFDTEKTVIVALPGPPHELQAMVHYELVPYLSRRFGTRKPGCSVTLRFVGLGQSQIDQVLDDHVPLARDITVNSQFQGGRVDFSFSLPDDTPDNRARLAQLKQAIVTHLGRYLYGEGDVTLEDRIVSRLAERETRLVLAEVGSAGALTAALSSAESSPRVLAGAYVAPTDDMLRRLLGVPANVWTDGMSRQEKVGMLATAAARATESPWALCVGGVRQEGQDDGYVDVALRRPDGSVEHWAVRFRGTGEMARQRTSTQLLDELRRRLP